MLRESALRLAPVQKWLIRTVENHTLATGAGCCCHATADRRHFHVNWWASAHPNTFGDTALYAEIEISWHWFKGSCVSLGFPANSHFHRLPAHARDYT
jgi:hypothetical protein